MASNPQRLKNSFIAINSTGKVQSAHDVPMAQSLLDMRLRCRVTRQAIKKKFRQMDCEEQYLDSEYTETEMYRWTWTFASVKPQLLALLYAYFAGASLSPTGTPQNEQQTLKTTNTAGSPTFSLDFEGLVRTSGGIPFNATATQAQAILEKIPLLTGNIQVTGTTLNHTNGLTVEFINKLAKANMPTFTASENGATGGSTTVTPVQNGANKYHALSNSTSDAKPEFSFVFGYKTGGLPIQEFINASVESFAPTEPRNGTVGLTVSVLSKVTPEILTGYSIPTCENYPPLKTAECSFQIDAEYKTREIASLNVSLNDNVPTDDDMFAFDSKNPDQFERGDQPSYTMAGAVFGAPHDTSDNLAVKVKAEAIVDAKLHFGLPGNRFSLLAPQTQLKTPSNDLEHQGSRNRSVIGIDAEFARDGANAPVKAEFYGDQTTAFLTT